MNIQTRKTTNAIFRGIIIIRYSILILSFFPVLPGYITQQVLEVNTRAIKNPRKQPQNFSRNRVFAGRARCVNPVDTNPQRTGKYM